MIRGLPFNCFVAVPVLLGLCLPWCSRVWAQEPGAAASTVLSLGLFSRGNLDGWEEKEFSGLTSYRLSRLDGRTVLEAISEGVASGLYRRMRVDLDRTPCLRWSWRVEQRLPRMDETSREGDDYAARVYVVVDGGLFFWKTLAVNYVWSSSQKAGSLWPNAFAGKNAMLLAVRSPSDQMGVWYEEKRNVREDFRQLFGRTIHHIDGVAIMTDTDNAGGRARTYYGDIIFTEN